MSIYTRRAEKLTQLLQFHSHCQLSQPVDPIFGELTEAVLSFENTEDRLLSRTIKVPQLQSLANDVLCQPSGRIMESEILVVIRAAKELDNELADWANNMPAGWLYSVATNINAVSSSQPPSPCYIPTEVHSYEDLYVARAWNLYRVSRLIIQSILLRANRSLSYPTKDCWQHPEITHVEKVNSAVVNDICASVPFLLGYDLSELKNSTKNTNPQDGKSTWPQSSTSKVDNSKHTGRFSLIWPLYLSCSVSSIPENQRWWMRTQLQWIAGCGEPLAKLLSGTQSQTLLGRRENIRFDCV